MGAVVFPVVVIVGTSALLVRANTGEGAATKSRWNNTRSWGFIEHESHVPLQVIVSQIFAHKYSVCRVHHPRSCPVTSCRRTESSNPLVRLMRNRILTCPTSTPHPSSESRCCCFLLLWLAGLLARERTLVVLFLCYRTRSHPIALVQHYGLSRIVSEMGLVQFGEER